MKYIWPFAFLGVLLSLKFWYVAIPLILAGYALGYQFGKRRNKDV